MKKLLSALARFSILRFAVIGALGMPVDWGVLQLMVHWGTGPYLGRMISWFCAATFTWAGNRYFTFRATRARGIAGIANQVKTADALDSHDGAPSQPPPRLLNRIVSRRLLPFLPSVPREPKPGPTGGAGVGLGVEPAI